jgi:hypothetical protein
MRLNMPYTLYPFSKKKKAVAKYALYSVSLVEEKMDVAKYALYSVSLFKEKEGCG